MPRADPPSSREGPKRRTKPTARASSTGRTRIKAEPSDDAPTLVSAPTKSLNSTEAPPSQYPTSWRHPSELPYLRDDEWSDQKILSHLVANAFTVPTRNPNTSDPWMLVTSADGTSTILPRKYRLPLLWTAKFQWTSLKLVLTADKTIRDKEWEQAKFEILHISRLCSRLLEAARNAMTVGSEEAGMSRSWRWTMFDRVLVRYWQHWLINRDEFVRSFWNEFGELEYNSDVLERQWSVWVLKGHLGFALTKDEVIQGITSQEFVWGLTIAPDAFGWNENIGPPPARPVVEATPPKATRSKRKLTSASARQHRAKRQAMVKAEPQENAILDPPLSISIPSPNRPAESISQSDQQSHWPPKPSRVSPPSVPPPTSTPVAQVPSNATSPPKQLAVEYYPSPVLSEPVDSVPRQRHEVKVELPASNATGPIGEQILPTPIIVDKPAASLNPGHGKAGCANCGATNTPMWRRGLNEELNCNACGLYFKAHNRARPMGHNSPIRPDSVEGGPCHNCRTPSSPLWRRDGAGKPLCNACGLYFKTHGTARPNSMEPRQRTMSATARQEEGSMRCHNCLVRNTPLWRKDGDGKTLCNACGLYYKLHRTSKPLSATSASTQPHYRIAFPPPNSSASEGSFVEMPSRGPPLTPGAIDPLNWTSRDFNITDPRTLMSTMSAILGELRELKDEVRELRAIVHSGGRWEQPRHAGAPMSIIVPPWQSPDGLETQPEFHTDNADSPAVAMPSSAKSRWASPVESHSPHPLAHLCAIDLTPSVSDAEATCNVVDDQASDPAMQESGDNSDPGDGEGKDIPLPIKSQRKQYKHGMTMFAPPI